MKVFKLILVAASLCMTVPAFANMGKKMGDKVEHKMDKMDENNDGKVSAAEHANGSRMMFEKMDTDKDGFLTTAELKAGFEHKKEKMKK